MIYTYNIFLLLYNNLLYDLLFQYLFNITTMTLWGHVIILLIEQRIITKRGYLCIFGKLIN